MPSYPPPPPEFEPPSTVRVPRSRARATPPPLLVALVAPDHGLCVLHAEWNRLERMAPEEPSSLADLVCDDDLVRVVATLEMLRYEATVVFDARLRDCSSSTAKLRFRATLDDVTGRIRIVAPAPPP